MNPSTNTTGIAVNNARDRKSKLLWGVILSCAITALVFAIVELRYPFFFTTDDNADWYASEYAFVIKSVLKGEFPMYCFTQFCGQRVFANGQSGVLNPFVYISALMSKLFFGDLHATVEFLAFLMMMTGAVGAYLLLERLGACQAAAIAGAFAWNFNVYNVWVGNAWILVILTTGILPFIFYGSVRLCDKPGVGNYLWAILPKAFLYYIGHPQFFFYAAVFDCLYAGMYVLLNNEGKRFKSFLKIIVRYIAVYIGVVILVLPQLIPQYQMIGLTSQGGKISFKAFAMQADSTVYGLVWPFSYMETRTFALDAFIGYPLIICVIAGAMLPLFLLTSERKRILQHKKLIFNMLATLPGIVIAFLANYSFAFKLFMYDIPIVNRFHFLHRNNLYLSSLSIVFACLAGTIIWRMICDSRKDGRKISDIATRIAGIVFVLLEVINMTFLFAFQPQRSRGPMYHIEQGYDEEYAAQFGKERYVCLGFGFNVLEDDFIKRNISQNLRYNLSTYYGINNISGYYGVYTDKSVGRNIDFFKNVTPFTGDVSKPYPKLIDDMRSQSVCWYIVNPNATDVFGPILEANGLTKVAEGEHGIIYRDSEFEPLAYDEKGNEIPLCQGNVNYLKLNTNDSFEGGIITLNYSYDSNFRCYIDGAPTELINDNDNWQMKFSCKSGAHDIYIRYEDKTFAMCCIITAVFSIAAAIGSSVLIYSSGKTGRKEGNNNE